MPRRDERPLHPGAIQPASGVTQVDPASQRVHGHDGRRVDPAAQALPTMTTTRGRPEWKPGKRVSLPPNTGPPVTFTPRMLEPGAGQQALPIEDISDVAKRLGGGR